MSILTFTGRVGLEQLVYVSTDTTGITNAIRAAGLLAEARRNNLRDNITGVLAITDGRFVQVLEGHSQVLDALIVRLNVDHRHRDMRVLTRRIIQDRAFPLWEMVSPRLAGPELAQLSALLDQADHSLDRYIDLLADAVRSQADALREYGYDPNPAPPQAGSAARA